MLSAHALGALETAEARAMEEHLRTCAECRAEFGAWQETASALAFASPMAAPSANLRTRILEKARATPQSTGKQETKRIDGQMAVTKEVSDKSSNVIPMLAAPRQTWSVMQKFGAIAASLIIAALALALVRQWQRNKAMEAEIAQISRQVRESERELARIREDKNLLIAPSVVTLGGTELAASARARLSYDQHSGRAMLVADGLPPAPEGKAYQLWFIAEGKPPMPGGVFTTDAKGHAELRDQMPPEGRKAGVFAVTLERAGGVPAPEGKAYLQGKVSS